MPLPLCIAGENAGPPDDVGGPHLYREFLAVTASMLEQAPD